MSGSGKRWTRGALGAVLAVSAGHALALAASMGALMYGYAAEAPMLAAAAALALVAVVLARLAGDTARLALCSFVLATLHGAGMALIPLLGSVCLSDGAPLPRPLLASLALQTAGMIALHGVLAAAMCRVMTAMARLARSVRLMYSQGSAGRRPTAAAPVLHPHRP